MIGPLNDIQKYSEIRHHYLPQAAIVTSQQNLILQQQQALTSLQSQMSHVTASVQEVGHIETGIMGCGNWHNWTEVTGNKVKTVTQNFVRWVRERYDVSIL